MAGGYDRYRDDNPKSAPTRGGDPIYPKTPVSRNRVTRSKEQSIQYRTSLTCLRCGELIPLTVDGMDWTVRSPDDIGARLIGQFQGVKQEQVHALPMTTKNRVLKQEVIYVGNISTALVRPSEVIRHNILLNAPNLVVIHNHPSGDPTPSADDLHLTAAILAACRLMDIELLDHIILGADSYVSLRERGISFDRKEVTIA